MQIAQVLGGYSLGGADLLRRAMGKKKPEEMAKQRDDLRRRRGEERASTRDKADELFDLMEKFAGYGFNKSHAAAYALLAYQTAWLKAHYPAAFMAANLSLGAWTTPTRCRRFSTTRARIGLDVRCRRTSTRRRYRFEPVDATAHPLRPGRDQGHGPAARSRRSSRRARRAARSPSLFDFCARVDTRARQPARRRGADQGRRVRRAACRPRVAARERRPRLRLGRARRPRTPTRAACSTSATRTRASTQEPALVDGRRRGASRSG